MDTYQKPPYFSFHAMRGQPLRSSALTSRSFRLNSSQVVIESDDHAGTGVGTTQWAICAPLLTCRPQLNRARDFREAQTAGAILNVA